MDVFRNDVLMLLLKCTCKKVSIGKTGGGESLSAAANRNQ